MCQTKRSKLLRNRVRIVKIENHSSEYKHYNKIRNYNNELEPITEFINRVKIYPDDLIMTDINQHKPIETSNKTKAMNFVHTITLNIFPRANLKTSIMSKRRRDYLEINNPKRKRNNFRMMEFKNHPDSANINIPWNISGAKNNSNIKEYEDDEPKITHNLVNEFHRKRLKTTKSNKSTDLRVKLCKRIQKQINSNKLNGDKNIRPDRKSVV